ncbi:MAG: SDR family oxidoreductase [Ginsengibacter sp.]
MNKIIVFGATGGTGLQVVQQALSAGYKVTAVVRTPDAFKISDKNLEVIKGDVLQPGTFENVFNGNDAIISCVGSKALQHTVIYSQGISNIINAMRKAGVYRVVCISAGAAVIPPKSSFLIKFFVKNILQRIFKYMYADMLLMEKILIESDLNWTVIRAPRLTNSPLTGKYRIATQDLLTIQSKISRADLADFIIKHLTDQKTFKARVEVSY